MVGQRETEGGREGQDLEEPGSGVHLSTEK